MTNGLTVRVALPGDTATIAEFNAAMAWETERKKLDLPTLTRGVEGVFANRDNGFYLVAASGTELIGSLLITYEWSDWRCARFWWIQSVYVKPEFRRCGVFKKLYGFVKAKATEQHGVCGLRLYVEQDNHNAQRCYDNIGLETTPYKMYEQIF